jgi:hypothetical protein
VSKVQTAELAAKGTFDTNLGAKNMDLHRRRIAVQITEGAGLFLRLQLVKLGRLDSGQTGYLADSRHPSAKSDAMRCANVDVAESRFLHAEREVERRCFWGGELPHIRLVTLRGTCSIIILMRDLPRWHRQLVLPR